MRSEHERRHHMAAYAYGMFSASIVQRQRSAVSAIGRMARKEVLGWGTARQSDSAAAATTAHPGRELAKPPLLDEGGECSGLTPFGLPKKTLLRTNRWCLRRLRSLIEGRTVAENWHWGHLRGSILIEIGQFFSVSIHSFRGGVPATRSTKILHR